MEEKFKIRIEIEGQVVKADCQVALGRFVNLTMTAPYNGIKTIVYACDENDNIRQYYDRQEAEEYAYKELVSIVAHIKRIKQYLGEYTEAYNFYEQRYSQLLTEFQATEESKKRSSMHRQWELADQALTEYRDLVCRTVPAIKENDVIKPSLLAQILIVI